MNKKIVLLTVNGGSSSIKCAAYSRGPGLSLKRLFLARIERIGQGGSSFSVFEGIETNCQTGKSRAENPAEAEDELLNWLEKRLGFHRVLAIGHRIVQGLHHKVTTLIDEALLRELSRYYSYDPDHLPGELALIQAFSRKFPGVQQVACFDTAFHADLPRVAQLLAIPRRFDDAGIRRYGFHGLSYTYLMEQLALVAGPSLAGGRIILAHLGSGSSITAVLGGKSMDTSMGFTPAGGVPMSTRSGDLDPGVAWYMMEKDQLSPEQFNHLINQECGLKGISALSSDMQDLLQLEDHHTSAAEAIAFYCYQVKKFIGAYAAVLGGLDALVFTGGIGEHAASIRSRICAGLDHLGLILDERRNKTSQNLLSAPGNPVSIYVFPTDEEQVIARSTARLLDLHPLKAKK